PVTVKMRLGWDRERITAPALAREFERLGVAAITIHGRTRQQGFRGTVLSEGIRAVVEAVERIPIVGNGDIRTVADAWRMRVATGCSAVAIGRGALLDPWIFRRLELAESAVARAGGEADAADVRRSAEEAAREFVPAAAEQIDFLARHFSLMV